METLQEKSFEQKNETNEWLKDRWYGEFDSPEMDMKTFRKSTTVTLWVEDVGGRHSLSPDVFPLEEVMSFDFVGGRMVGGLSFWRNGQEIFWQRFDKGIAISIDENLEIDTKDISLEIISSFLS